MICLLIRNNRGCATCINREFKAPVTTYVNQHSLVGRSSSTLPTRSESDVLATRMESQVQSVNEYEELRNKRIAENNAKLESLGILPLIRCVVCDRKLPGWRQMHNVGDSTLSPAWLLLSLWK